MTGGAVSAAISGGNPLFGALVGGAFGFIAGGGLSSSGPILGGGSPFLPFATGAGGDGFRLLLAAASGAYWGGELAGGKDRSESRPRRDSFNILLGGGFSLVVPTGGVEGSAGVVINPSEADIGVFSSIGAGGGFNISSDVFLGFVRGDVEGLTVNFNVVIAPISLTTFQNLETGETTGLTFGFRPIIKPPIPGGASITLSHTSLRTLHRDLIPLFKRLIQKPIQAGQ